MTTRTFLARRGRWILGLWIVGAFPFAVGIIIEAVFGHPGRFTISRIGFGVATWIVFIAAYLLLRCPRCRGNLMGVAYSVARSTPTVHHCPHCGVGYDEELSSMKPIEPTDPPRFPPLSRNRLEGAGITARTLHKRRNRQITGTFLAGVTAMLVCFGLLHWRALPVVVHKNPEILAIVIIGSVVAIGGARVARAFGFRCPRCRGKIRSFRFWWLSWDTSISCCPYCGLGWDEELSDEAPVDPPV